MGQRGWGKRRKRKRKGEEGGGRGGEERGEGREVVLGGDAKDAGGKEGEESRGKGRNGKDSRVVMGRGTQN